jgi:2-polyprenyl-3-methyl-5-hydroxy-6-metoxy-1,4-benzoquinol methylase
MAYIDFITKVHSSTKRNYLERVTSYDKAHCAEVACRFDKEYWDGERQYGYGGMKYDGRWVPVAEALAKHYDLQPGHKVLDVGCGKGFLLFDLTQAVPGLEVQGIDVSSYAIKNARPEIREFLQVGDASSLQYDTGEFDLVISLNTIHNLYIGQLFSCLREMQRVSRGRGWIVTEAYRNEQEKVNLMYWQLTCRAFHTPEEWEWIFRETGYAGDYAFIFFE